MPYFVSPVLELFEWDCAKTEVDGEEGMKEYIDNPSAEIGFEFELAEERATVFASLRPVTRRKWEREWLCSFPKVEVGGEELYVEEAYGA